MAWNRIRGHDAARTQLQAAYTLDRLAHAYLFIGPDGVGKRLFATEFAKTLLCENPPAAFAPCDQCSACIQVQARTHPDFFAVRREEDKNELSVETIREFTHRIGLKAGRTGKKIGLVEEADHFNESSANAFLKPLEEPPSGTTLVLLASSLENQLPTIVSRCQVLQFSPLRADDVRAVLANNNVTNGTRTERLIRIAGGSPGRALQLNDDAHWDFRCKLVSTVSNANTNPSHFVETWMKFVEGAGKQAPAQRQRAVLGLRILMDIFQVGLRSSVGAAVAGDSDEIAAANGLARQTGVDRLTEWIDLCTAAESQIERYLPVGLVIEALADRLAVSS